MHNGFSGAKKAKLIRRTCSKKHTALLRNAKIYGIISKYLILYIHYIHAFVSGRFAPSRTGNHVRGLKTVKKRIMFPAA